MVQNITYILLSMTTRIVKESVAMLSLFVGTSSQLDSLEQSGPTIVVENTTSILCLIRMRKAVRYNCAVHG